MCACQGAFVCSRCATDDARDLRRLFPLDDEGDRDRERREDWLEAAGDDPGLTRPTR